VNFLVTSNAEIRVFKPIIESLLHNEAFVVNIVYLSHVKFDKDFEDIIVNINNVRITKSIYPILESIRWRKSIFVICLDFLFYPNFHKIGIEIIDYLNEKKLKTICMQHGGTQADNIIGQSTSRSKFHIVYGKFVYEELTRLNISEEKIFLTGNPSHDNIQSLKKENILKVLDFKDTLRERKIVLIATCLHTEYMDRENEIDLYRKYINKVYSSIDFKKYVLIVKMHPSDSIKPNIYFEELSRYPEYINSVKIIKPREKSLNFYECSIVSDLIISRSSTVIEEAIMLNKKVISFDLFHNGPSKFYKHLDDINIYKRILGLDADLRREIDIMVEQNIDNQNLNHNYTSLFTYKLDGKSNERVMDAFNEISKL
jgi:CDP-glycerol glycerophosphotransferase (TagB/SpsB family)